VFIFFVEGDVAERLVWNEFLFLGILSREIEVGMPCARVEIDLVAAVIIVIEWNGFLMMGMTIDNVARCIVEERGFFESILGK